MIVFQGVAKEAAAELCYGDAWQVLHKSDYSTILKAPKQGIIEEIDALKIGRACVDLGAGRTGSHTDIDASVGIELLKTVGDNVDLDEDWVRIYHSRPVLDEHIARYVASALSVTKAAFSKEKSKIVGVIY